MKKIEQIGGVLNRTITLFAIFNRRVCFRSELLMPAIRQVRAIKGNFPRRFSNNTK